MLSFISTLPAWLIATIFCAFRRRPRRPTPRAQRDTFLLYSARGSDNDTSFIFDNDDRRMNEMTMVHAPYTSTIAAVPLVSAHALVCQIGGGAASAKFYEYGAVEGFIHDRNGNSLEGCRGFHFHSYTTPDTLDIELDKVDEAVVFILPLPLLVSRLVVTELRDLCRIHGIKNLSSDKRDALIQKLSTHTCIENQCAPGYTLMTPANANGFKGTKLSARYAGSHIRQITGDDALTQPNSFWIVSSFAADHPPLPPNTSKCVSVSSPHLHLIDKLTASGLHALALYHNIKLQRRGGRSTLLGKFKEHNCSPSCTPCRAVLEIVGTRTQDRPIPPEDMGPFHWPEYSLSSGASFPPSPTTKKDIARCVGAYCRDIHPNAIEEGGCCVCGQLCKVSQLKPFDSSVYESYLLADNMRTRKERTGGQQPITPIDGIVVDQKCKGICNACDKSLSNLKVPRLALARGLWLGDVPNEL
jgi:hypothetical protein